MPSPPELVVSDAKWWQNLQFSQRVATPLKNLESLKFWFPRVKFPLWQSLCAGERVVSIYVYMETDYLYGSQLFWLLCRCDSTLSEKQLKCCHCGRAHSKLTSMRALKRPQREMIASHKIFSQFFFKHFWKWRLLKEDFLQNPVSNEPKLYRGTKTLVLFKPLWNCF